MKPIVLQISNPNPFDAGWLACHLGLKLVDCLVQLELVGMDAESFTTGFNTRAESADMEDPYAEVAHGRCHIVFLGQATDPADNRHRAAVAS